jgi:hypothetical protein
MRVFVRDSIRLCAAIGCIVMVTRLASAAPDVATKRAEIIGMPLGTNIEVRLKDRRKLRGARGAVSDSGFTLVQTTSGERQVAFDDVASVKHVKATSHTGRNVLIGVGIGVGTVIVIVALAHKGGYL